MRVTEKCKCGAQVEVVWDGEGRYRHEHEPVRAGKELENFRRRHKECLKSPTPTITYQQPPIQSVPAPGLGRPINVC